MEQHWKSAKALFGAVLVPPLFWLALFFLVPMGIVWLYSFGENRGLTEIALTGTFSNYLRALDPLYLKIFVKSVGIAGLTTLICLVVGFPVALAITFAPPKAKTWLLLAVMLPFWTNLLIRTYALIAVLRTEGYVNQSLEWLWNGLGAMVGVLGLGALGPFQPLELLHNNFAVVLGLVYVHLPFMVLPLYSAFERFDFRLLEAAYDLYASRRVAFFKIVLPVMRPGLIAGSLLVFIPSIGSYLAPDILGGGKTLMIGNLIGTQFQGAHNWPFGAALSMILLTVTLIVLIWMARRAARKNVGY